MTATTLLIFAALLATLYEIAFCWRETSWPKSVIKTGSVAVLALAAPGLAAPMLIVAGLALGALGDFFLSRPGEKAFLAGMAAFAAGHLAYAAEFWTPGTLPPLVPALVLLALGISTEFWLAPRTGALRWPVRAYVGVITLMALAALTLGQDRQVTLWGAVLFVLSDLFLSLDLFVVKSPGLNRLLSHALWAAYWSGQALILLGMAANPPF
ncbi:lysoplasmalogenase [Defluviimonas aestuarii]|uniref:lysoplasmalogenase n=1 Tax=Albidovulum aestuarii TaxID=1130726 RepID=UPI00249B0196|nr:lysoplasmalogenase [Defluviimonas aestuarii]MDI3335376.1 lysoplasmalogenase [Defluviimonas aestuarii]